MVKNEKDKHARHQKQVLSDEDYIYAPKYENSIDRFLDSNDSGADAKTIASFLFLTVEEVKKLYVSGMEKVRSMVRSDDE